MKRKLFIAIYVVGIVIAVMLLDFVVTTIRRTPATPLTAAQDADLTLSQFTERPNANLEEDTATWKDFFLANFFQHTEALSAGCSLRFSHMPVRKAIEPFGNAEYAIKVTNLGRETCENVSLSLYYPDQESFSTSTPAPTASDYYWSIGNLKTGDLYAVSLVTKTTLANGQEMLPEGCAAADNSSDVCSQTSVFARSGASKSTTISSKITLPSILRSLWSNPSRGKEFGIWVWDSPGTMSGAYASEVIAKAKENGFNVIYVTVDDYLPITQIRDEKEQAIKKDAYMKSLSFFIQAAKSAGIAVDVVGGAKDWAIDENRWKGYALIDFVKEYNALHGAYPIRGLQYDVEPYLLSDYNADKAKVLKQYVSFIDESAKRMKDANVRLTIVIPHFYDREQNWTSSFSYNGADGYAFTHLLRVLAQKSDTAIIIMAYRNFFEGDNGIQQISEAELKEAAEGGYGTKIILAQETGNVSPAYVTYHDYPKSALFDTLGEIQGYFKKYKNYGGVAVHYFDPFLMLK